MTDILYAAISLMQLSLIKKSAKVVPEPIELQSMNGLQNQSSGTLGGPQRSQSRLPGNATSVPMVGGLVPLTPGVKGGGSLPGVPQVHPLLHEQEKKGLIQELKGLKVEEDEDYESMVPLSPPRLVRQSGVYSYRKMSKKLQTLQAPAVSLYMDAVQGRVSTAQGTATWFSGGNLTSQNSINTGLTSSPECLTGMGNGALNNDGSVGNTLGRGRSTFHNWEVKYRWMNQSNCPVEVELYTFRCVKPMPALAPGGLTNTSDLRSRISAWYVCQVRPLSLRSTTPTHYASVCFTG